MKRKETRSYLRAVLLFIFAACLIGIGGTGVARAVPTIVSEYYSGGVEMYDIGVTLVENGTAVSSRSYAGSSRYVWDESYGALLGSLLPEGEEFHLGETYDEVLSAANSGSIDEFVRVTIYKYWLDESGRKLTTLSPDLIDLHLVTGSGWVEDTAASSAERTVLYYTSAVPVGGSTSPFSDTLTVNGQLPYKVTQSTRDNVITTSYDYDDVTFQIDVQVDAVQTHSGESAIRSAWGREVAVSNGSLSLR